MSFRQFADYLDWLSRDSGTFKSHWLPESVEKKNTVYFNLSIEETNNQGQFVANALHWSQSFQFLHKLGSVACMLKIFYPKMAAHHPGPPFCCAAESSLDPAPDSLDQCLHLKIPSLDVSLLLCASPLVTGRLQVLLTCCTNRKEAPTLSDSGSRGFLKPEGGKKKPGQWPSPQPNPEAPPPKTKKLKTKKKGGENKERGLQKQPDRWEAETETLNEPMQELSIAKQAKAKNLKK